MSREWLTLLIRRMDAVASVYRLASLMSPGNHDVRRDLYARLLRWQRETEDTLTLPEF